MNIPRLRPSALVFRALVVTGLTMSGLLLAPVNALANEIAWDDLLPPEIHELDAKASAMHEQLLKLDDTQREVYRRVAEQRRLEKQLATGYSINNLFDDERALLRDDPAAASADAVDYWQRYEALYEKISASNETLSPALNGKDVRLPGYLLPLEMDGTSVREFLLVPYVGACIHSPPPPRNQMVFVQAPEGYEPEGLYEPIWVEGTMSTDGGIHSLNYIDGQADIDAGYRLSATKVEAYKY